MKEQGDGTRKVEIEKGLDKYEGDAELIRDPEWWKGLAEKVGSPKRGTGEGR